MCWMRNFGSLISGQKATAGPKADSWLRFHEPLAETRFEKLSGARDARNET